MTGGAPAPATPATRLAPRWAPCWLYWPRMPSVADRLRAEDRARTQALSAAESLQLAFRLGDEAVADFARLRGLDRCEAARALARRRQQGRRASGCMRAVER